MPNKLIGKLYEKRGNDVFEVVVDPSGDVVGVTQYEQGRLRFQRIDFFVESVPELVTLLHKAAGIPVEEYEYSVAHTYLLEDRDTSEPREWADKETAERWLKDHLEAYADAEERGEEVYFSSRLVKRRKAGKVEDA